MDSLPKDRLKRARMRHFDTAAEAARSLGIAYSTYAAHENGQNDISVESARFYSRAFKVPAGWILTGEGNNGTDLVPLLGYVGAGFAIMPLGETDELERVDLPPGASIPLMAVKVKGSSMEPAYYDGDLIFYQESHRRPAGELIGRECIIRLRDGSMYLKRLLKGGTKGKFVLFSHNSTPIVDAEGDWAWPVEYIKRS